MKINQRGITRIVFIFDRFVIKIPNFTYQHSHFLQGCYANWIERLHSKQVKNIPEFYDKIAPSFFCSWFGLIQIMAKCEPCDFKLSDEQKEMYKDLCGTDNKSENFGIYKGRLVCLDYV